MNPRLWCGVFFFLAVPLLAQSEDSEQQEPLPEVSYSETVVTSRKREEVAQKVPITITTITETEVLENGIDEVRDFVAMTPNLSLIDAQNPGNHTLTMRGITKVRSGDQPVAVIIDGIYQASPNALTRDWFDVSQIEILRGPQGALYGRNSMAGVISITTNPPSSEPRFDLRLGLGNGGHRNLAAGVSGPLSDTVFYRISGSYLERDGLIDSDTLGQEVDRREDTSLSAKLYALLGDHAELSVNLHATDTEDGGPYYLSLADGLSDTEPGSPFPNLVPRADREIREGSVKLDLNSEAGKFTAIAAFNQLDEFFSADFDFTNVDILRADETLEFEAQTLELRFTSPDDTAFRWIAGAFYQSWERGVDTLIFLNLDPAVEGYEFNISQLEDNDNTSSAFYVQGDLRLQERWELSGALRYDRDEREQTNVANGVVRDEVFDAVQTKLSLAYFVNDQAMVFGSYADGFRSGGFNPPGVEAFPNGYGEETTRNLEFGFKLAGGDDRWLLNAALFYTDFEDQQVFVFDVPLGAAGILNIDESEITGLELDWRLKASEHFDLNVGFGYSDTEIKKLDTSSPFFDLIQGPVSGNKAPNTPETSANIGLRYHRDLGEHRKFVAKLDYEHTGELYWHIDNVDRRSEQNLLNARLSYGFGKWTVALFGKNLGDEQYFEEFFAREFTGAATDIGFPSQPRTYGIEARFRK
ncbi:TonB-dependent receptor [Acanthopleuribacter pedis]|uniref:TonB-dependent receptor n=2 Tax=Acanthopleuribacter pedis TaxID=442870 RepID=A0A8J7U777_9BACT|nr:TonB-dependent receptor [Acanthopleuribacter pedis]